MSTVAQSLHNHDGTLSLPSIRWAALGALDERTLSESGIEKRRLYPRPTTSMRVALAPKSEGVRERLYGRGYYSTGSSASWKEELSD
jgi:hypothetical protein